MRKNSEIPKLSLFKENKISTLCLKARYNLIDISKRIETKEKNLFERVILKNKVLVKDKDVVKNITEFRMKISTDLEKEIEIKKTIDNTLQNVDKILINTKLIKKTVSRIKEVNPIIRINHENIESLPYSQSNSLMKILDNLKQTKSSEELDRIFDHKKLNVFSNENNELKSNLNLSQTNRFRLINNKSHSKYKNLNYSTKVNLNKEENLFHSLVCKLNHLTTVNNRITSVLNGAYEGLYNQAYKKYDKKLNKINDERKKTLKVHSKTFTDDK